MDDHGLLGRVIFDKVDEIKSGSSDKMIRRNLTS